MKKIIATLAVSASFGLAACGDDETESTSSESTGTSGANTAEVVSAANAFLDTLDTEQQETALYDFDDAAKQAGWSNFPTSFAGRNGIPLSELDTEQADAVLALMETVASEQGFEEIEQIRLSDDYLAENDTGSAGTGGPSAGGAPGGDDDAGGPDDEAAEEEAASSGSETITTDTMFSAEAYFISFFGEPSDTEQFMVQFGGHHLAYNVTYEGDSVSFTPTLTAVEPQEFETDGETIAPMEDESSAAFGALGALSETELAEAEINGTFDDLLLGPQMDTPFPEPEGAVVADLPQEAQDQVTAMLEAWVGDFNEDVSESLIDQYVSAYDETYLGWSEGNRLKDPLSYVRLDGPEVWIEFSNQGEEGEIHHHTVIRSQTSDYGGS